MIRGLQLPEMAVHENLISKDIALDIAPTIDMVLGGRAGYSCFSGCGRKEIARGIMRDSTKKDKHKLLSRVAGTLDWMCALN